MPEYVRDAAYALQPRDSMKWIIDGIVSESSVNIWVGKFGSKKTWALLSAAVCVAQGKSWLGHDTIKSNVLFVDEDMGEAYLNERANMSIRGELGNEETPLKYCSMHGFDLRKPESVSEFKALIMQGEFRLVIIDALCNVMPGADENSVKETQVIFHNLRRIADETKSSIILAHHTNKANEYRGSTAIPGGVDCMLLVKSDEGSEYIYFETGKHHRGLPVKFAAKAVWTENRFYLMVTQTRSNGRLHSQAENFVIRYLTENGESPLPAIKGAADSCSMEAARKAVYKLASAGVIKRTNPDDIGKGAVARYILVDEVK